MTPEEQAISALDLSWLLHGDHGEDGPIESCSEPRCVAMRDLLALLDAATAEVERHDAARDLAYDALNYERARIAAEVRGLPEMVDTDGIECVGGVDRAAVLAAIEGAEHA